MPSKIRKIDYFYTSIRDQPGEAYKLLSNLENLGVNLLAFTAVPTGPDLTQLTLFPEDTLVLTNQAQKSGMKLDGPYGAILVQGDDKLGAVAGIHMKLYQAKINIYASTGVTDGVGSYGYIVYVRPDQYEQAVQVLEL